MPAGQEVSSPSMVDESVAAPTPLSRRGGAARLAADVSDARRSTG